MKKKAKPKTRKIKGLVNKKQGSRPAITSWVGKVVKPVKLAKVKKLNNALNVVSPISLPQTYTDLDLTCTEFPQPRSVVPGLISEGVVILAGRPKTGKSRFAEHLGQAVARGDKALGLIDVEQHEVLYLALEDTPRRVKSRLSIVPGTPTNRFHYSFAWPRVDQGGLEQLDNWLKDHPDTKFVIIDTLGKIRSRGQSRGTPYDRDYSDVSAFKKIADQFAVAIVLVHHLRKATADDYLDLVSGTTGITGAADTVAVLRRERMSSDASLFISGRDIEEQDLALHFDPSSCSWTILGQAEEYRLSKERQDILNVLKSAGRSWKLNEIATALGKKAPVVHKLLAGLIAAGFVEQPNYGHYKLHENSEDMQAA